MAWTPPRTWISSEVVTAAIMNTHVRDNLNALNGFVVKAADEAITSSAVLQNDNHLLWTIPQAGSYVFEVHLFAASAANAAGDIQLAFTFPTGTISWHALGPDPALASGTVAGANWLGVNNAAASGAIGYGLSTSTNGIVVYGLLVATASGTLQLQWAQLASNVNATTVKQGSYMTVKQVA